MTRDDARRLRDQLDAALAKINVPGFTLKLGNCTFGATATFKLECCPVSEDGTVTTRAGENFRRLAPLYGLGREDLGRTFRTGGREYTIVGINARSRRTPVLADRSDGRKFRFQAETVRALLAAAAK